MKIDINKSKYGTALNLVEHERYYDALTVFSAFTDDYEAQLNRVGCLCAMGELIAATKVLRKILAKFSLTHNVIPDVVSLGEPTKQVASEALSSFVRQRRHYARRSDKQNADATRLGEYKFIPNDNDGMGLELDFFNDSAMWDMPAYATDNFYDVRSKVYRDYLRFAVEKAYVECDDAKLEKFAKRLLEVDDGGDIETLEAQVIVCFYMNKRTKAVKYIEKLSAFDNISSRALRVALSVMFDDKNCKRKKVIARLLESALKVKSEFSPLDLCDIVVYTHNILGKDEYAYEFAKELYQVADRCYGALDYLRVCACAFYNGKDKNLARDAVLRILEGMPEDDFAICFLQFLNADFDPDYYAKFDIEGYDCRNFWLPKPLVVYEEYTLFGNVSDAPEFDDAKLAGLGGLINHSKALAIADNETEYIELINLIRYGLSAGKKEKNRLVRFCKERLADINNYIFLNEALLQKLVQCDCYDNVFVGGGKCYWLDLSVARDSKLFALSLCSCAALMPVDVKKVREIYDELSDKLGGNWPDDVNQLQLAYYLLCKIDKKFASSPEAQTIRDEDKKVFEAYM